MAIVTVRLPEGLLNELDGQIEENAMFETRSEAIRHAVREFNGGVGNE